MAVRKAVEMAEMKVEKTVVRLVDYSVALMAASKVVWTVGRWAGCSAGCLVDQRVAWRAANSVALRVERKAAQMVVSMVAKTVVRSAV